MFKPDKKFETSATSLVNAHESSARTYSRTFHRTLVRGQLAELWDIEGRQYIDCLACAGALPLGHNHPFVHEKVINFLQSGHPQQALDIPTVAKTRFVKQLLSTLPAKFSENAKLQFCGPTGSDAVEAALKLFKTATGRRTILAFHGAYHGMTLGSLSLMGNLAPKQAFGGFSSETYFLPFPQSSRCPFGLENGQGEDVSLNYLENILNDPESGITKPAAVILEAVQGEAGCIIAPNNWLRRLREITANHDIPLIIDEIQTGFGRTGKMFAFESAGIIPDAVLMSKALGGGFPLAVLAYHKRFDQWQPGAHAGTFRGNQIAMVAGAATMQYIIENGILSEVENKGKFFRESLEELKNKYGFIGEIRGRGLMLGIEILKIGKRPTTSYSDLDGVLAREIKQQCYENGLLIETGGRHGAVLRLLPPLIITEAQIGSAIHRLSKSLDKASMKFR